MKATTRSAEGTRRLAAKLAARLKAGAILVLVGDYGSGKTTFVQGLAAGLKVPELRRVCSPTFVMLNVYEGGRLPLYHMDATRLEDPEEAFRLGWEESAKGVTAIEWGEKIERAIRVPHFRVELAVSGSSVRRLTIQAPTRGRSASGKRATR